jgi:hypothetical protein
VGLCWLQGWRSSAGLRDRVDCLWTRARPVTCARCRHKHTKTRSSPAFAPSPTVLTLERVLPTKGFFVFERERDCSEGWGERAVPVDERSARDLRAMA